MKLVTAIIKPFKLDKVREALAAAGVSDISVMEAKGLGRQRNHPRPYRGSEYQVDFVPKVRVEITVPAERVDAVVDIIVKAANTGRVGDGKILISNVERVIRIRADEPATAAVT